MRSAFAVSIFIAASFGVGVNPIQGAAPAATASPTRTASPVRTAGPGQPASEIIIAIRYLQTHGVSHSHLYLYREDGKLLRQLTKDNSGQDVSPIFAPDGETIVFMREQVGSSEEIWSIDPHGKNLQKLAEAPEWYRNAKSSPYFTNIEEEKPADGASPAGEASPPDTTRGANPPRNYKSPDGTIELILREDPKDEDDQIDGPGHGKHYLLRDIKTGLQVEFGKMPGFFGAYGLLHERWNKDRYFLFENHLRLAFFDLHLNSTDGDTCFAFDLKGTRFVRLSPNWAVPIPLPGESSFLTYTENRYVPIPGSSKTANCSYLEHWDENLKKIRYARAKTAAVCYGMSIYRPGQTPRIVTIRRHAD